MSPANRHALVLSTGVRLLRLNALAAVCTLLGPLVEPEHDAAKVAEIVLVVG